MSFKMLSVNQLIKELDKYTFRWFQVHHTWEPDHADFTGHNHMSLQRGMRSYHMNVRGWQDIGQHVTLFPDGMFVTGRPFNMTPAGIKGYNTGAFMMEMIGNFDKGNDPFEDPQKHSAIKLAHYFLSRGTKIMFHREKATKTCPGTGIDKKMFINEARAFKDSRSKRKFIPSPVHESGSSVLKIGDRGLESERLQSRLVDLGYSVGSAGIDGIYGPDTKRAVKQFQSDCGITVDGLAGPQTMSVLDNSFNVLKIGARGAAVRGLQSRMRRAGFDPRWIDGVFGEKTKLAVIRLQKAAGISQDGIVGPQTRKALKRFLNGKSSGKDSGKAIVPYPGRPLKIGSIGVDVKRVQRAAGMPEWMIDGIFGEITKKNVMEYQKRHGLKIDGIVGPETWNRMF